MGHSSSSSPKKSESMDAFSSEKDVEFLDHNVTILKVLAQFGSTHLYAATTKSAGDSSHERTGGDVAKRKKKRTSCIRKEHHYLVKATTTRTQEQAFRAENEVKLLRRLRPHPNLVTLVDCGFSTLGSAPLKDNTNDRKMKERGYNDSAADLLPSKRVYCYLFAPCPDETLADFISTKAKELRRSESKKGVFGRRRVPDVTKTTSTDRYLSSETVLCIFSQMCEIVRELHTHNEVTAHEDEEESMTTTSRPHSPQSIRSPFDEDDCNGNARIPKSEEEEELCRDDDFNQPRNEPHGILHMDLQPNRFVIRKQNQVSPRLSLLGTSNKVKAYEEDVAVEKEYEVQLVTFGCAGPIPISLLSTQKREYARYLIDSATSLSYRAPEMMNLHLHAELNGKVDTWGLGCCLYELLFMKRCFDDEVAVASAQYTIPHDHPYSYRMMQLLDSMLEFDPSLRPTVTEVCENVERMEMQQDPSLHVDHDLFGSSSQLSDLDAPKAPPLSPLLSQDNKHDDDSGGSAEDDDLLIPFDNEDNSGVDTSPVAEHVSVSDSVSFLMRKSPDFSENLGSAGENALKHISSLPESKGMPFRLDTVPSDSNEASDWLLHAPAKTGLDIRHVQSK